MPLIKFLIEYFLIIFIGILLITQVILPSFIPRMRYWWLFRKAAPKKPSDPLENRVSNAVDEFKEVKDEVDENLRKAQDLKDKTRVD